jgi:hemerythrin-like domain-containing protein
MPGPGRHGIIFDIVASVVDATREGSPVMSVLSFHQDELAPNRPGEDIPLVPTPWTPEVFRAPLDFIIAEHGRQMAVCNVMERLRRNPRHGARRVTMEAVRSYLIRDYPLHLADEEEDLFPLLLRRCPREDSLDEVLALLLREHAADADLHLAVIEDLTLLIGGRALDDPARAFMDLTTFGETQRRHLAWENAIVIPRAQRYLIEADHLNIGRHMARRRGIALHD